MQRTQVSAMTEGPFFKKIVLFAVPVTLTGLLQIVYNTADTAVVGHFAGKTALAAVGSTGSMISLIVNLFTGLSMGAGVLTARMLGAKNAEGAIKGHLVKEDLEEMTYTQLKELAKDMGIETGKIKSKAAMIEAICSEEVYTDADDVVETGEEPPTFEAQEVVE